MNPLRLYPRPALQIRLSEVIGALSAALDLVEGQPEGHSIRSALIGVRLGHDIGLGSGQLSSLFYTLLMKNLGCSSNASKMCFLFGADDRETKGDIKTIKLGVSNLILDKPGRLDADELAVMRKHPGHTQRILSRVTRFNGLAELAGTHHERLDGKGYHRGLDASQLLQAARILCVANMYEALAAKRPYRQDMTEEEVMTILQKNSPAGICPRVLEALTVFLDRSGFVPHKIAA